MLKYAAVANHGNRVLLRLWEEEAMDRLARRVVKILGGGTTEKQLEAFMLSCRRHIAIDNMVLWSDRSRMTKKNKSAVHKLNLASLWKELVEEEATKFVGVTGNTGR